MWQKRIVGKSIPFSMHKVKKPENFTELVRKVDQETKKFNIMKLPMRKE